MGSRPARVIHDLSCNGAAFVASIVRNSLTVYRKARGASRVKSGRVPHHTRDANLVEVLLIGSVEVAAVGDGIVVIEEPEFLIDRSKSAIDERTDANGGTDVLIVVRSLPVRLTVQE